MASPTPCEYVTVARGYKVVYNAPADFFSYENCADCAEGGDAVLMEEGECPRCGSYRSYKRYECCESCDSAWLAGRVQEQSAAVQDRPWQMRDVVPLDSWLVYLSDEELQDAYEQICEEPRTERISAWISAYETERMRREQPHVGLAERREELRGKTLSELQEHLAKIVDELPGLEEDLSENGQKIYHDALLWKATYEQAIGEHEHALTELEKAKANYHSALMSNPDRPGYDRCCSNFEDEVVDAERYLASL
jgi:hypothetical protein